MANTVKVGCRLPSGLSLRVSDWVKGPDGERMLREVARYELSGSGAHLGQNTSGMGSEDDAAFTDMPADHWALWFDANKDSDLVTSGAVFKGGARAQTGDASGSDPVQMEAEAQREILGEQISPDPKADADAAKRSAKTAKTL
jgi:hypothetical protein